MAQERIMAEGTPGPGPESTSTGSQVGPAQAGGSTLSQLTGEARVVANASLTNEQRVQAAQGLLGTKLTQEQEKAILEAHQVGSGEPGKDKNEAGIYNYTSSQLRQKAEILKAAGFNEEQRRSLIEGGFVGVVPDWLKELAEQPSSFQDTWSAVRDCLKVTPAQYALLTPDQQAEFDKLKNEGTGTMNEILVPADAQEREELQRVLYFVKDDIRRIYTEAMQAPPRGDSDSWYSPPTVKTLDERLESIDKALADYQERFWDYGEATLKKVFGESADISALRQKYQGIANYVAARAAVAIGKELKGVSLQPDSTDSTKGEFGDYFLSDIKKELEETKGERERARREKRKRATADERLHYNNWREKFDFTWAETPEELDDSIEDWLDYFQQQLPLEAEEAVYQEVTKGLTNALSSLEQARNRIGLEANSVMAQQLREKIVAHVTTIAGARLLESRGGFEYFIKLKTDFAANYNAYFDGIYKKKGSAIMADKLSENSGEIYRGGPEGLKKPLSGDTKTFRGRLEREAIRYGVSHELYITEEDFENAKLGDREIMEAVASLNLPLEEGRRRIEAALAERRKNGYQEGRYGWDDSIEELLLFDSRGLSQARALVDPHKRAEAVEKVKLRTGVFMEIKKMLDKEDTFEYAPGRFVSLARLSPDQRKEVIRYRIKVKMTEEGNTVLLQEINALPDQASQDRALWKWVKDYNKPRIELRREGSNDEPWFPSLWDGERLSISTPEDLIDRVLSKDEFNAMVEEVNDPYKGLNGEQVTKEITSEFHRQFQREVEAKRLSPEATASEVTRLMRERQEVIKGRIEEVLFDRKQRETRAIRNYNINIAQDKFEGLQARWGGLVTREIGEDGDIKMRTIYSLAEEIIKAKIDKEAQDIEAKVAVWKSTYVTAHPQISDKQLEEAIVQQRRLFRRNATFAATLALREVGVAKDLPIWDYFYYSDQSQIGAFAPLVGYTDDDKGKLPELLDRGRRETEAVFYFLAEQHMDGKMLDVQDNPGYVIEDENGVQKEDHEERWVRPRVINEGGVIKLRNLFESMFMVSTSGGVEVVDLIIKAGNLGINDELWENGCKDKREWQGFRKRRNRWELRQQSFFNTREWADPITYVKRLVGADNARKFLVGGEIQGQGSIPGVLIEPMSGAYKYRDQFFDDNTWAISDAKIGKIKQQTRGKESHWNAVRAALNDAEATKNIDPVIKDKLVEVGAGILKPLIDYMNARKYVMNRAGLAPKNWKYDNDLIVNAYFEELLKRPDPGADTLGPEDLGYAEQGRSPVAVEIFRDILKTSTYHILVQRDRNVLYPRAEKVKKAMKAKRVDLMNKILPADQAGINEGREGLELQDIKLKQLRQELTKLEEETGKAQAAAAKKQQLEGEYTRRRQAEDEFIKLMNKAVEDELNRQFNAGDLSNDVLRKRITYRRQKLLALNTKSPNLEREIYRLINQYVDTKLHMEFVGEWPARLIQAA